MKTQHSCSLREFGKIISASTLPFTGLLCWPVSWSHTEGHAALLSVQGLDFPALGRFGKALRSLWCSPAPPAAVTIPTAAVAEQWLCFLSHPFPAKSYQFIYRSTATGMNFLPNSAEEIFTFRCPTHFPSQVSMLESFETALNHIRQTPSTSSQCSAYFRLVSGHSILQ